jgi:hypothetical protein
VDLSGKHIQPNLHVMITHGAGMTLLKQTESLLSRHRKQLQSIASAHGENKVRTLPRDLNLEITSTKGWDSTDLL